MNRSSDTDSKAKEAGPSAGPSYGFEAVVPLQTSAGLEPDRTKGELKIIVNHKTGLEGDLKKLQEGLYCSTGIIHVGFRFLKKDILSPYRGF